MVQKIFRAFGTINSIIRTQSLDVVAVSGATFSGNGILEAAANALNVSFSNPNSSKTQGRQNHGYNKGHGKGSPEADRDSKTRFHDSE